MAVQGSGGSRTSVESTESGQKRMMSKVRVRLSILFAILTIAAIALAWWVDHRRLTRLLGPTEKVVTVYRLRYIDATEIAATFTKMYGDQRIAPDAGRNGIVVFANDETHKQIELLLPLLDQPRRTPEVPAQNSSTSGS
jgi:hypothetical protein